MADSGLVKITGDPEELFDVLEWLDPLTVMLKK